MSKLNTKSKVVVFTHEGGVAKKIDKFEELARMVSSCLLWESTFYVSGVDISEAIYKLALECPPAKVAKLAIKVRNENNIRHAPLVLLSALAKTASGTPLLSETIPQVLNRADEMGEFLSVHAHFNKVKTDKIKPVISAQMKKGIAAAFGKFDSYQLGKYNRDKAAISLKDVMFLCHPKPKNDEQKKMWESLINDTLPAPDTWEVALSGGADPKEAFTRLIKTNKLGYMALLRNLRNMEKAMVDRGLVNKAIEERRGADKVLPFRFIAAARACPTFYGKLSEAMIKNVENMANFDGRTAILVDVSGSMRHPLSAKSDLNRMDAAGALAVIFPGYKDIYSFSDKLVRVERAVGIEGVEKISNSQRNNGTRLIESTNAVIKMGEAYDRIVVITDEQDSYSKERLMSPTNGKGYIINVGAYRNGVDHAEGWIKINGFSEQVINWMAANESFSIEDYL